MKPQFAIYALLLALAILVIVFRHQSIQKPINAELAQETTPHTNLPAVNAKMVSQRNSNAPPPITTLPNPSSTVPYDARSQEIVNKFVEQKNVPINFYGQVIDQDSNALAGVTIKVAVQQITVPDPAVPDIGATNIDLERITGADGRFEINGWKGEGFDLESIQKDGYEVEPTRRGFGSSEGSSENPVIFKMWNTNIHEQLITGEKTFKIMPDGRPYYINFADGTINESGQGDLKLWIKRPEQIIYGHRYDWSCGVEAINSDGLLREPAASVSMYQAPADGYTTSFSHVENATTKGWGDTTGLQRFYVKLDNGQEYGRFSIELEAYYNDQTPALIRLSYAINPDGSRIVR